MRWLGYIVTTKKLQGIEGFVGQVDDISKADPTKPILIVGWDVAKQYDTYNILNRKLGENLYWTFKKSESRIDFEADIKKFYDIVMKDTMDKLAYKYVNIFNLRYSEAKKIINIVNSMSLKSIYINDNMLYLAYNDEIYGISLSILEYCKINVGKFLKMVKSNDHNRMIDVNDWKVARLARFLKNKRYAVPYFFMK